MKLPIFIGVDPGSNEAGIGVINGNDGSFVYSSRLHNWTPAQANTIVSFLNTDYEIKLAAIEKVGVMPGQGIVSSGKFMKATGILIGIFTAHKIPLIEVVPQKWKKISPNLICSKCSSAEKKQKSLLYAQQRFPQAELSLVLHHNVADALGIADWLYTTYR